MPEFVLDFGSSDAAKRFRDLDSFTQGYVEALFFTSTIDPSDDCYGLAVADLSDATWQDIEQDCKTFQAANREDLDEATDNGRIKGYDDQKAGRDFWYSRNGHGVGFWDRGLGDVGEKLDKAADAFRVVDAYKGDDDKLYLA